MKRLLIVSVAILLGFAGITLFLSDREEYVPPDNLREAMQERMTDMLRVHEALSNDEVPEQRQLTAFAGLPNSIHVSDVSEYQDFFVIFENMYGDMFTSENPKQKFNIVIQSCIACHQNVCPGPLRSMNRLIFPATEL
ncbi:MAG: hypothetical protein LAT57_06555 [Balneolales bacterium]|nr:hypothetical protein [Balneolales bacterium]